VQVFGLLAVEVIAFVGLFILRPFEGQRLNLIVVYMLGFSKVATVGLSVAFDTSLNVARITTTVIGIVIIVIQGILTVVVMIAIAVGAISTYFSLTRQRDEIKPKKWNPLRKKYFEHMDSKVSDIPPPPPPPPEEPKSPYFSVKSIRRFPKIEDEDPEFMAEIGGSNDAVDELRSGRSRATSMHSQMSYSSLPPGARVHRASWSSRNVNAPEYPSQHSTERRRTRGDSLSAIPDPTSRPTSRATSELNARMLSSYEDAQPLQRVRSKSPFPGAITSTPPQRRHRSATVSDMRTHLQTPTIGEDETTSTIQSA
jgi:hypothetical protein